MDKLYKNLSEKRNELIKKYKANGEISYSDAIGLTLNNVAIPSLTKEVELKDENGNTFKQSSRRDGIVTATGTRIDFEAYKCYYGNKTMAEVFREKALNKVITVNSDDLGLDFGPILLMDVPCMLKLESDIKPIFGNWVNKRLDDEYGIVHSVDTVDGEKTEDTILQLRGQFKENNYRGDADFLTNPVSLWAEKDSSGLSMFQFGFSSIVRMWGSDQVIDLNGFIMSQNPRPNVINGFSAIVDLSNDHFLFPPSAFGPGTIGSKNAFILSSKPGGILERSNHFAVRGHNVEGLLMENVQIGGDRADQGPYFASVVLNRSSKVVLKEVHQIQSNHHVTRSSLGLNWPAVIIESEIMLGKYIRVEDWEAKKDFYPWLKWDDSSSSDNGKETQYPTLNYSSDSDDSKYNEALKALKYAYEASTKNFDDMHIQINPSYANNAIESGGRGGEITDPKNVFRTTNLTAANSVHRGEDNNMYPDSTYYGFRIGSASSGTGKLANDVIEKWDPNYNTMSKDVYLIDCSFEGIAMNMTETVTMCDSSGKIIEASGNMGVRPLGYSNTRNPAISLAAASMHVSREQLNKGSCSTDIVHQNPTNPVFSLGDEKSLARIFATNAGSSDPDADAEKYSGLYKGNDVLELSLANFTAALYIKQKFPKTSTNPLRHVVLDGLFSRSNIDAGVLAWRKSMMDKLGALTACHVGLKGGYNGDISDKKLANANEKFEGEIYPWIAYDVDAGTVSLGINQVEIDDPDDPDNTHVRFHFKEIPEGFDEDTEFTLKDGDSDVASNLDGTNYEKKFKIVYDDYQKVTFNLQAVLTEDGENAGADSDISDLAITLSGDLTLEFDAVDRVKKLDKDIDFYSNLRVNENKLISLRNSADGYNVFSGKLNTAKDALRFVLDNGEMTLVDPSSDEPQTYYDVGRELGILEDGDDTEKDDDDIAEKARLARVALLGVSDVSAVVKFTLVSNSDGQNHTGKGIFGVRFDQVSNCGISECKIQEVENGALELNPFFSSINDSNGSVRLKTNLLDECRPGSHINDFNGVSVNGCENVFVKDLCIDTVTTLGNCAGVEVSGNSRNVELKNISIDAVDAGRAYDVIVNDDDPFNFSVDDLNGKLSGKSCVGVKVSSNTSNVCVERIITKKLTSTSKSEVKSVSLENANELTILD